MRSRVYLQYLEELQKEFSLQNHSQIETVARPYAFIKFGAPRLRHRSLHYAVSWRTPCLVHSSLRPRKQLNS